MCARRFLILVTILTLLAVVAAFAIFQYGERVLIRSATPTGRFEPPPPSSEPDYGLVDSWIARPDIVDNPARWRPAGFPPPQVVPPRAATFFIHPTTYLRRDRWNAPLSGERDSDSRASLFVRSQASAFGNVAEIWAPRYRQAAYGAFLLNSEDAQSALDLAYGDIASAFDDFLDRVPPDQPLILAGHSQGALHLSRLLADRAADLEGRLVAAYVVGWPLSVTADLPPMRLPPCTAPAQTGCVLSWHSFAEPANPDLILGAWAGTRSASGIERRRSDMLCVNPITGTQGGAAPPSANAGTLVPSLDLASATIEPGRVGARCDKGLLIIDGDIPPLGPFVLPGNNYHVYDYALFWWPVASDAFRRVAEWQR